MIGDILKGLRIKKGATQDDMAALLNIKRQTYSAYERNVSLPDIPSITKLASYFNVSVGYIINDEIEAAQKEQPLSPEQQALLIATSDLSDEDLQKALEYVELLKLKRNS